MFWSSVRWVAQAWALKSSVVRPTPARSSSVIGSSSPPFHSGLARVRWATATSGGWLPTVASVSFE